ncbi:MAG TPA: hypothetical protein VF297_16370 [Pyrinomonadaceae bacterium]
MPNRPAKFITWAGAPYGSSLYYVTPHWVIRCSGNSNGRTPETIIRQRDIVYIGPVNTTDMAEAGRFPRDGDHNGNAIVAVLDHIWRGNPPAQWVANNGVTWETAVDEIDAAIAYAQASQHPRASREVGQNAFHQD